jgi:hypothetical protein
MATNPNMSDLSTYKRTDIISGTITTTISGDTVTVASGVNIIAALTDDGGGTFAAIGTPNSDGADVGESLYTQSFSYGYDEITGKWNRIRTNKSGQGSLVVASSGQDHVITEPFSGAEIIWRPANQSGIEIIHHPELNSGLEIIHRPALNSGQVVATHQDGDAFAPFSGYGTTNAYVYSGFGFLKHAAATILIKNAGPGSGAYYTIRGYPLSGILLTSLGSGALYSGDQAVETLTDAYDYVEIGVESVQDNFSSVVTVTVARR